MNTMLKNFVIILTVLLLIGCTSNPSALTEDELFQIDVLYDHTVIMIEFSSPNELSRVNLQPEYIQQRFGLTPEEKVTQLEQAFSADLGNISIQEKIVRLEEIMNYMMLNWVFDDFE